MKISVKGKIIAVAVMVFLLGFGSNSGGIAYSFDEIENQNLQAEGELDAENNQILLSQNTTAAYNKAGTIKRRQPIVVIDPGHGGFDPGALGMNKSKEKNNTLSVALKLGKELQKKGVKVIYTRQSDKITFPTGIRANLQARAQVANRVNADLFISIHNNSSIYSGVNGTETYYCGGSSKSKALASFIQNQLVKDMKLRNRGVRSADFYVLRKTKNTAALIELGYITNSNEEAKLRNSKTQDKYAAAIATGIMKYLTR